MSTIKEFLIALGYSVDASSEARAKKSIDDATKRVDDHAKTVDKTSKDIEKAEARKALAAEESARRLGNSIGNTITLAVKLAVAFEGAAATIVTATSLIASRLDDLYYSSRRTGASAENIRAFGYAVSQLGGTSEGAAQSLEKLAENMRSNPGVAGFLRSIGVQTKDARGNQRDLLNVVQDLQGALGRQPYHVAKIQAEEILGLDERTLQALLSGKLTERIEEYRRMAAAAGTDLGKAAEQGKRLTEMWTSFWAGVGLVRDKVGGNLAESLIGPVTEFRDYLLANADKIAAGLEKLLKLVLDIAGGIAKWLMNLKPGDLETFFDKAAKSARELADAVKSIADSLTIIARILGSIYGAGEQTRRFTDFLGLTQGGALSRGDGGGGGAPADDRNWWQRTMPKALGGKDAPNPTVGGVGTGSSAGNLTKLIEEVSKEAGIDPRIMQGIRAGESGHSNRYDVKDDAIESSWGPFQLNRRRGLGVQFEKETGLDVRDPSTIAAQARWVARYIAKGGSLRAWMGYRGPRDADPRWGDSGYKPEPPKKTPAPTQSLDLGRVSQVKAPDFSTAPLAPSAASVANDNSRSISIGGDNITVNANGGGPDVSEYAFGRVRAERDANLIRNLQSAMR